MKERKNINSSTVSNYFEKNKELLELEASDETEDSSAPQPGRIPTVSKEDMLKVLEMRHELPPELGGTKGLNLPDMEHTDYMKYDEDY